MSELTPQSLEQSSLSPIPKSKLDLVSIFLGLILDLNLSAVVSVFGMLELWLTQRLVQNIALVSVLSMQTDTDEYLFEETISGLSVRLKQTKKKCNCTLSSFILTGEVFFDGQWTFASWNLLGNCSNGFREWSLSGYPKNTE